nr:MAG TPA: hypothetical protein [Caudoviricetes sp.]
MRYGRAGRQYAASHLRLMTEQMRCMMRGQQNAGGRRKQEEQNDS